MPMVALALNCGSSSVKFGLFQLDPGASRGHRLSALVRGQVDDLSTGNAIVRLRTGQRVEEARVPIEMQEAAIRHMLARVVASERADLPLITAVGHRVVHVAERFRRSILVDDEVVAGLEALEELAPLHNRPSLTGIRTVHAVLGPRRPMVAVFDTAFSPEHSRSRLELRHSARALGPPRDPSLRLPWPLLSVRARRHAEMTNTPQAAATVVVHEGFPYHHCRSFHDVGYVFRETVARSSSHVPQCIGADIATGRSCLDARGVPVPHGRPGVLVAHWVA